MFRKSYWNAALFLSASAIALIGIAAAQTPVTVSNWGTPVTIVGGGKPNGPAMLDSEGQIPVVNLGGALSAYLPLAGGTLSGPVTFSSGLSVGNGQPLTLHDSNGNWVNIVRSAEGPVQFQFIGGLNDIQAGRFVMGVADYTATPYASLPKPAAGYYRTVACSDCYIGSGSKGILVLYNGTAWVGLSGEAVSH